MHTLEGFAAACHQILTEQPGRKGREQVCALLQQVLEDDAFVSAHLTDDTPERKILYEDPQLGFCILAHVYRTARESAPHDHGHSWAIYGQARGETVMSDWSVVELEIQTAMAAPSCATATSLSITAPGMAGAVAGALQVPL